MKRLTGMVGEIKLRYKELVLGKVTFDINKDRLDALIANGLLEK